MTTKIHPPERLATLPKEIETKDQLHEALRVAMELELSTIPPYLTALYSIKPGTNTAAYAVIQSVVMEEMLHLTLAGNVLTATGGAAALDHCDYVPQYPTRLPHSSETFTVPLASFSRAALNTFLKIEHPGPPGEEARVEGYHDIGQFYAGIEDGLKRLNRRLGPEELYDGHPSSQVQPSQYYGGLGDVIVIVAEGDDPKGRHRRALKALEEIVEQGEGLPHSLFDGDVIPGRGPGKGKVPAHYFRFEEILKKTYYKAGDKPHHPTGAPLDVDWKAVYTKRRWPSPPRKHVSPMRWYRDNGHHEIAEALYGFNTQYMSLLGTLQEVFTGRPDQLMRAVTQMYDLKYQAQALLKTPDPRGRDTVGPSFECIPPDFWDERAPAGGRAVHGAIAD